MNGVCTKQTKKKFMCQIDYKSAFNVYVYRYIYLCINESCHRWPDVMTLYTVIFGWRLEYKKQKKNFFKVYKIIVNEK